MKYKVSLENAIQQLQLEKNDRFTTVMKHGSMRVEYYAPIKIDPQSPHSQDELYVIASGHGSYYCDHQTVSCKQGDVLFAPAGMEHRFTNFSDDFATWVIFYGPDGKENPFKV